MKNRKIKLWVNSNIVLNTEIISYTKLRIKDFFYFIVKDSQVRSLVVKKMKLSYLRMIMFYVVILVNYFATFFLANPVKNIRKYLKCY